jgi:outer membrane lipopolysaccharide assembly protein LptE/RlpB
VSVRLLLLCAAALFAGGCGYHVSGHSDLLPSSIKTIAIPAFGNVTGRYRLTEMMPQALTREFISRTRYRVSPDENEADAVLKGAVVNYMFFPSVIDQVSGRAAGIQVLVVLQLTLYERASGKVLFTSPAMEVRNRYEIAIDPKAYLEESDLALERVSRDVARTVVSSVLESF